MEPKTDFNGGLESNLRDLLATVFGSKREPGSGLVARMARIEALLGRIQTTLISILATLVVALIVNVVVLLGN